MKLLDKQDDNYKLLASYDGWPWRQFKVNEPIILSVKRMRLLFQGRNPRSYGCRCGRGTVEMLKSIGFKFDVTGLSAETL